MQSEFENLLLDTQKEYRNRTGFSCPYFFEIFYKNVLTNIEKYVII